MSRIASGLFSACFLVLCLLSCQASASDALPTDSDYYLYKTITKADGLSQLSVFDIKKDQDGFYWLATAGGLYRFDGLKLKKFEFGDEDSDESASHFVRCVQFDNDGRLWVGTQRGLLFKEPHKNTVTEVPAFAGQIIWSVSVYNENELLISTQDSLWKYDYLTQQKKKIANIGKVKSIVQLHDSLLLGTFSEGLVSLNVKFSTELKLPYFGMKINKIKELDDNIYIASSSGFYKTDGNLSASPAVTTGSVNDFINQQDEIILARDNGIYIIKNNTEQQISTGKTWSLALNDSLLIAGTHTDGLKEYQHSPLALSNIKLPPSKQLTYVADIGVLDKDIYFSDNIHNLYKYNRRDKTVILLENFKASSIFSSAQTLLISNENSINIIDEEKRVKTIIHKDKVLEADHDQSWYILDENKDLYKINDNHLILIKNLNRCNFGYPNLLKIRGNDIFVGGDAGLCKFEINKSLFQKVSDQWTKSTLTVNDTPVFFNKKGQGVDENGTIQLDLGLERGEDAYSFSKIKTKNSTYIISSTSKGIRIYKYIDAKLTLLDIFDSRYQILSEYVAGSVTTTHSGLALFGGVGGISTIDVRKLSDESYNGSILTSGIKIYNEPKPALQEKLAESKDITLESYQYPLNIAVSLLNYPFPDRAKLQYKLSSYGDSWYNFDGSSSITLSKLDSGLYEISFRALDKSRVVATSPQYSITILPPWWRSNMAFFLYSLLILGVIIHVMSIINNRRQQHAKLIESEERLKLALWGSGDELWDWDIKSGNIYRSNIWNDFLLPEDGFRSKDNQSNIYPKDLERVKTTLQACLTGEKEEFEVAYRVHDKAMNWVWVLDRGRVVEHDDNGLPSRMTGTLKNISHLKKTEEMLKLLATSFKNISDAVCIVDQDFVILEINDSFTAITGQSREEAVGQPWNFSLYNDSFIEQVKQTLDRAGRWHDEIEAKRKNGVIYPIEITIDKVFDEEKDSYNFVAVFSDISERKEKEKELERLTNTDTLTGLPNRSFFMSTLDRQVRKGQHFALLLLDLNNFKQINDSLGHQLGDLLLIEVAERLQKAMQSNHTLYRLGGDEFAVIIDNFHKLDDLTRLSTELHQQLLTPFNLLGEELTMSCAIGAVLYPDDGLSPEHLLRNADAAMYHAKHEGSETCQFFSSSMNEQASARLAIENRIRKALREDLFSVYYQPKVETSTGRCTGAEALLRLPDGKGGFISPAEFIPIAEESGLILDVGNWVLEASCRQVKVWHEQGIFPGRIAINLSARQFRHSDLVAQIDKVLAETQLPAHVLEMEITESTMMEDPIRAIAVMERLRSRNITLAMDDFGTGYSSLSNLRQFPVTSVKIDRAFVKDLTSDQGAKNLTGAIISLADSLELHVVAEGVETEEQLAILKDLNCPTCQGFLFGRPVPAREFEELVTKNEGMLGPEDTNK